MIESLRHKTAVGIDVIRKGHIRPVLDALRIVIWSERQGYGFRRDLSVPFTAPDAAIPISVRPATERDIQILFDGTGEGYSESERGERRDRAAFFRAGGHTSWVAVDEHDTPCFFQSTLTARENAFIERNWGSWFPTLQPHQTLLEDAFTPEAFRGRKIMPAAMARIAEACASGTVNEAITFVNGNNIPSLKGCLRSGFHPYCTRRITRRFFRHSTVFTPLPAGSTIPGVGDR